MNSPHSLSFFLSALFVLLSLPPSLPLLWSICLCLLLQSYSVLPHTLHPYRIISKADIILIIFVLFLLVISIGIIILKGSSPILVFTHILKRSPFVSLLPPTQFYMDSGTPPICLCPCKILASMLCSKSPP